MKFAVISDTHGQHKKVIVPEVDCLIHCGDISSMGTISQVNDFMDWFSKINIPTKIFVAGNHDFLLQNDIQFKNIFSHYLTNGVVYLNDSLFELNGIKIYGSPMSPRFGGWAFMENRGEAIKKYWDKIPIDTDILITHSPPNGILDETYSGVNAGCEELIKRVKEIQPQYHLFGHIHEGRGRIKTDKTEFINATCLDERYKFKYQPYEFTINLYEKTK